MTGTENHSKTESKEVVKTADITIMDFSKAYEQENFFENAAIRWVDCTNIHETNCYCSMQAESQLEDRVMDVSPQGIHFLDSGNYHYVSGIWMNKLGVPFDLILIDHHPDMQLPQFDGVISCGGWVKQLMESNPYVQNVILIDVEVTLLGKEALDQRVRVYSKQDVLSGICLQKPAEKKPVYISLDKDVLGYGNARTQWSQGKMTFLELKQILNKLFAEYDVLGMDICGESADFSNLEDVIINNRTNKKLLQMGLSGDFG